MICYSQGSVTTLPFSLYNYHGGEPYHETNNDTPIAHTYDFINNTYLTGCHTAYLWEYKSFMPGKLLTYFVMNYCKDNGIGVYDFSRGECDKKAQFAKEKSNNYNLYYGNRVFISIIKLYFRVIRQLKCIKRKLRELKLIK